jgi:Uma2 family endonuclease
MAGSDDVKTSGSGMKLTYEDLLLFPDDRNRHELIDGEHYVTPSPNFRHQRIALNLILRIGTWLETHPLGQILFAPLDVIFTKFDVVEPDVLYISNERAAQLSPTGWVTVVPEIVVEIGSPSTRKRDETIKLRLYERSGVSEYWIVDPDRDVIRVYRREGEIFAMPLELSSEAGDVLTTPFLPGLDISLSWVFRDQK